MPWSLTRDYVIASPPDRWVKAACEQVGCDSWRYGWDTLIDEATPLGAQQAAYIRRSCGRTFGEMRAPDGLTVFRFDAYQRCFAEHRTRPQRFLVRGVREHTGLVQLAEDYTEHTGRLADQAKKG